MKISVVKRVLNANFMVADSNRKIFKEKNVLALNLISSPGSGKTTLLEKTAEVLSPEEKCVGLVGDLQTSRDADRLSQHFLKALQINTGTSCHLYANQITAKIDQLPLAEADFLFIENVGNMVCPGEFDLGENLKVILLSVPEGDDKVAKYPTIFRSADLVLLTKIDLLKILPFSIERVKEDLAKLNVHIPFIPLSTINGDGFGGWIDWLRLQKTKALGQKAKYVVE